MKFEEAYEIAGDNIVPEGFCPSGLVNHAVLATSGLNAPLRGEPFYAVQRYVNGVTKAPSAIYCILMSDIDKGLRFPFLPTYAIARQAWNDSMSLEVKELYAPPMLEEGLTEYPHVCPLCGSNSFNGLMTIDCSNSGCRNG